MARRMQSPFPGMDPWLEHPAWWPNVHQSLITYARDALQGAVGERYFVSIGERVYVETGGPDFYPDVHLTESTKRARRPTVAEADEPVVVMVPEVELREVFLEIIDAASGDRVVTVIEVLSPANKRQGMGRDQYLTKQRELLGSSASLVEIDLLRAGAPTVALPPGRVTGAYRVVVSPAGDRARRELYAVGIRDRLPRVAIPLLAEDQPAVLDLGGLLAEVYEKGGFGRRIDYAKPPVPPLAEADQDWAREAVAAATEE